MHWFDTREGKLVIGDAAYEDAVVNSQPGDIVPLAKAVLAKELWFPTDNFDRVDARQWTEDDFRQYGRWAINVVSHDKDFTFFMRDHLDRLGKLGVGPGRQPVLRALGPRFSDFLTHFDEPLYDRLTDNFTDWSRKDYANYAASLVDQLGKPPTTDDYTRASQAKQGPSPWLMTKHAGTPGEINALLGYPNVYFWEREDYIAWGARVQSLNKGRQMTTRLVTTLSKRGRGPGFGTVKDEFGTLSEFQRLVDERYQADPTSRIPRERKATMRLQELLADKLVNQWQLRYMQSNQIDIVAFVAKYDVLVDILTDADELEFSYIALEATDEFVAKVLSTQTDCDLEDIQLAAIATGHTDDIWPLSDRWSEHLQLKDSELGYVRKGNLERFGSPAQK